MHPVLFKVGSFTVYTYGFCIAIGALLGFLYMYWQGKKQYGLTFDQSNNLFILLILGGVVGGKLFMLFEDPSLYLSQPKRLFSGSGFVFYGSLLTAIPIMLWYFKKIKVPVLGMLDVMAAVTCIVHGFGRIGCFMAGCCYGLPTDSFLSVVFTNPVCQAEPLHTPLYPTQLVEAIFIFSILALLVMLKNRKQFDGQLFLIYLMVYAVGRGILEMFRGDIDRGFLIENILSNSQFISLIVISAALYFYIRLNRNKKIITR
ncbi:MAG TPA: prolipoprotein diacylglyceryl transferase [Cyclobacteriaceae bacterium]|nr:prolipoprotein diacylglyceryl transferase [Cytophagales bacterium]HNT49180.1 prolipoprotein diacylglyceryl transferase [Cyclobacteriaceae bacterium]HRE67405.1 prolipoprotein diacylglyceryl transferase [Cyclobacteriaceae bacterium]HRF33428.1 prolipoprotein diacylglyceryl transferase [Cyclobacteriaceae bacterium]